MMRLVEKAGISSKIVEGENYFEKSLTEVKRSYINLRI